MREDRILPDLDRWLNAVLAPHQIAPVLEEAGTEIAAPPSRLVRHPAAQEADNDASMAAPLVADTETTAADKTASGARTPGAAALSEDEASDLVRRVDALRSAIADAEPRAKERLYERLVLKVTYHPGRNEVRVEIELIIA